MAGEGGCHHLGKAVSARVLHCELLLSPSLSLLILSAEEGHPHMSSGPPGRVCLLNCSFKSEWPQDILFCGPHALSQAVVCANFLFGSTKSSELILDLP
jgi:hypothetical protein